MASVLEVKKRLSKESKSIFAPSLSGRQKHSIRRFIILFGAELRKPLPTPTDQMAFSDKFNNHIEGGRRPTMKKTYRYIPSEQGRESDPIFNLKSLSRRSPMSKTQDLSKRGHTSS